MWCNTLFLVFLSVALLETVQGQCSGSKKCSTCITASPDCRWCKDKEYSVERCSSKLDVSSTVNCKAWVDPQKDVEAPSQEFTDTEQISPKLIKLKIRPGEDHTEAITVKSAENYPLDLYYLMDFSFSMNDDLQMLKRTATGIAESLKNVSTDYKLGFGTFVDKPTAPYANTYEGKIERPCDICDEVHSYNHIMNLTGGQAAKTELETKLNGLKISSNIDNPEGGFDALVQAAVCQDIGWRNVSRKVVFYATDAIFHTAGDGKLAGIIKPNEGKCGMTGNKYTRSLEEDYPSIGQLNDILIKQKIIPIFAVTSKMQNLYDALSDQLTQLSQVGLLDGSSQTVINLIEEQLNAIVSRTKLNPQAPSGVTVEVTPKCNDKIGQEVDGAGCKGVRKGENVVFDVNFRVDECVEGENKYNFNIDVPGIATLPVEIEMICSCACENNQAEIETDSSTCDKRGDLICGACECKNNTYGSRCECDRGKNVNADKCKNPKSGLICSGENNGMCICGQCECIPPSKKGYKRWGAYCECSNYECKRNTDYEICSNNGYCNCGKCECDKAPNGASQVVKYTGDDCGCPISNSTCKKEESDVLCSGNGECQCGKCLCKKEHYGQFCDICQDCGPLDCSKYTECVKCVYLAEAPQCNCSHPVDVSAGDRVDTSKLGRHKQCVPIDDPKNEGCSIIYYLHYKDKGTSQQPELTHIYIDRKPDCPSAPNIIAIVAGVIGGILGIGILLLVIWKIVTHFVDKREYEKFLEERSKAKWNSGLSPLYKEPMTKYTNPLYTAANPKI